MGTEILRPQDCLMRRPLPAFRNPNPKSHPKQLLKRSPEAKKRREGSPKPAKSGHNLVMGQVTILKRGVSLDSKAKRKEAAYLAVFGTGRIGVDPEMIPKQIRLFEGRGEGWYAGSAFSLSPSPRALPLPNFSRRKEGGGSPEIVDFSATKDLRRLLRLD